MKILEIKTPQRRLGDYGERQAVRFLRRSGYKIVKKNFVADSHEIDVIARDKETLIFVEVKTRTLGKMHPSEPRPASAVNAEKQRSIISAARFYTAYNPCRLKKRFDIIEVYVNAKNRGYSLAEIKHLKNTFNVNTAFQSTKGTK